MTDHVIDLFKIPKNDCSKVFEHILVNLRDDVVEKITKEALGIFNDIDETARLEHAIIWLRKFIEIRKKSIIVNWG